MDMKVSVKDGKDITVADGITVINTLSIAEKEEKKVEPAAVEATVPTPEVTAVTQTPATTVESTISSLNPTIPNIPNVTSIPNVEIPVPNVPVSTEPSPLTSVIPTQTVSGGTIPGLVPQTPEQNYGQSLDMNNQYINNEYNNSLEKEVGESVFKDSNSVTTSRDLFLKQVGELFDEKLADPVNTSVEIANRSMDLLKRVFQDGMNVSSFKEYQELIDLYNGIKSVDEEEKPKDEVTSENNDYNPFGINNDLSKMNIPRF